MDTAHSISEKSADEIFKEFGTNRQGLTLKEAKRRYKRFGPNLLKKELEANIFTEFISNFKSPLVLMLIVVAGVSFFLGEIANATIVTVMVFLSVFLDFFQEHRANSAAKKLIEKVAHYTQVVRGGGTVDIRSKFVTLGDILELNSGDMIPADAYIIDAKDLFVNESSLSGEAYPVEKSAELKGDGKLLFSGTSVVSGAAHAVVVAIGVSTKIGEVAKTLAGGNTPDEFTKGINKFSVLIIRIIIIFVIFIFFTNAIIKHDLLQSLTFAIAIAVGLTPEFLPIVMSINMSLGSIAMARKGVIVKRLTAIPTFGSLDILCTDKTGTLTQDNVQLTGHSNAEGLQSESVFEKAYIISHFETGITNPLDKAVLAHQKINVSRYKKIDEIPFDFERRRMSVVVKGGDGNYLLTKGSPETIIFSCEYFFDNVGAKKKLTSVSRSRLLKEYKHLSSEGFRTLGVAERVFVKGKEIYTKDDEKQMTFIGFLSFLDPVKLDAKQSVDELERMGIEVKLVTGDNELVAQKVCRDAGIEIKGLMLGADISRFSKEDLYTKAQATTVFARFLPEQKRQIIEVLKSQGKVVGFLGDGINDSPSLKTADVGISVSNAVDVAKESADIILTKKNLHELKEGVVEGRKTFGNTMKYIMMGLSSNFGNMLSVLGAVILLPFLPMIPIQILLNNFLYDLGQFTLPTDSVDKDFIKRPRHWDLKFIRNFMIVMGPVSSVFDYISFGILYFFFRSDPTHFQTGWFIESLATQTLVIFIIRTKRLPFLQSSPSLPVLISILGVVFFGWILPYLPVAGFFGMSPLPLFVLALMAGVVLAYLLCVEVGKRVFYKVFMPGW